jgi:hypothetical protein
MCRGGANEPIVGPQDRLSLVSSLLEAAAEGGTAVAEGTPEDVAAVPESYFSRDT